MPRWMILLAVTLTLAGLGPADFAVAQEPGQPRPAAPEASNAEGFALDVREHQLENGMQVLVVERPAAGRVGTRLFVRVDVAAERPGTWGSTHMLEHSLFKGSRYIGTRDWEREAEVAGRVEELARRVEDERNRLKDRCRAREAFVPDESEPACGGARLDSLRAAYQAAVREQDELTLGTDLMRIYQYAGGTNMTASTGTDWMKFDIDLPAEKLELFMYVERSRLEHPVFRQFDPEREVVVDQIRRAFNRPDGAFERTLQTMTYAAHPYGQAHWFSDLEGSQREDHWKIFHQFFIPQNAFLVVVGDVEAERVFALAERWFGDWRPGRPSPRLRTVEPIPVGEKRLTATAAAGPTVAVNARIPAVGHPDLPALDVLAELLGGPEGMISRALGERVSRVSASAARRKYPGHFSIRADAPANDGLAVLETGLDSVLRVVAQGAVPPSEIHRAVAALRFGHLRNFETVGRSAVAIGMIHAIHDWRHLNELPGLWAAVGPEDLARVAREYLPPDRRVVGILRRERSPESEAVDGWPVAPVGAREGPARSVRPAPEAEVASARGTGEAGAEAGDGTAAERSERSADARTGEGAGSDRDATEPDGARAHVPPPFERAPNRAAEQVWWTPPWMVEDTERFVGGDVPEDWRALELATSTFRGPEMDDLRTAFGSGLRAVVVRDSYLPFVRISALLDVTPVEDPAGREGASELLVQLLRNGGTERLSPGQVDSVLAELGASVEVRVERDRSEIELAAPAAAADRAARLLTELLTRPRFDDSVFRALRERHAVRAERATDAARELLDRTFEAALYGANHPLARRPDRASVSAISRQELIELHRRWVTPERTAWAVSGRIDPGAVRATIAHVYGTEPTEEGAPAAPRERQLPGATPPRGRRVVAVHRDGMRQAHVLLGHLGIEGRPEDAAALELTHYVLCGGGFGSRMMDLLRTRTGITAALYCHLEPGMGVRYPYAWRFSGNPHSIAEGILKALEQIEEMRAQGPTRSELENARTAYVEGYVPAAFDTPHKTAVRLAHRSLLGLWPYTQVQYLNYYAGDEAQINDIQDVTLDEARRAAAHWLHPDDLVIAVVGDLAAVRAGVPEGAEWLREALRP